MRTGGVFHPNFSYAPRRTTDSTQLVRLEIFDLAGMPDESGIDNSWTPGIGITPDPDELVWVGQGRVQPNKDWRARPREVQFEYDGTQAVRIQIPIGKNLVGAVKDPVTGRYTSYGTDPHFIKDMKVRIVGGPIKGFEIMEGDFLYVRNAIQNQNLWVYNLLCDTKTGGVEVT